VQREKRKKGRKVRMSSGSENKKRTRFWKPNATVKIRGASGGKKKQENKRISWGLPPDVTRVGRGKIRT